jgi:ParB family transcriptional regulator, chromosome partitioning protein
VANKGGLGRGLESLMGQASVESGSNTDFVEMKISNIEPNPNQPRTFFDPDKIAELAASIKKEGLLQPILVREVEGGKYQVVAGERRYHACKSLDMDSIPVRIVAIDEVKAQEIALVENLQRDDLNPIEEALGYKRLIELGGFKQKDVAEAVCKNTSTISNALRLLDLPEEVQELMYDGKLTAGHARTILSLPVDQEEARIKLAKKIVEEKLSVREAESIARLYSVQGMGHVKKAPAPRVFKVVARKLRTRFDTNVRVKSSRGKYFIEIEFKDEDDLQRIFDEFEN